MSSWVSPAFSWIVAVVPSEPESVDMPSSACVRFVPSTESEISCVPPTSAERIFSDPSSSTEAMKLVVPELIAFAMFAAVLTVSAPNVIVETVAPLVIVSRAPDSITDSPRPRSLSMNADVAARIVTVCAPAERFVGVGSTVLSSPAFAAAVSSMKVPSGATRFEIASVWVPDASVDFTARSRPMFEAPRIETLLFVEPSSRYLVPNWVVLAMRLIVSSEERT